MPVIDKICYVSRLRYMNTGEKFAFSFLTLIACLISRSVVMALFVLAVMSAINVGKSGIAPGRYMKLMLIPFGFLLAGTAAVMVNVSGEPLDAFALPVGGLYLTGSKEGIFRGVQMVSTALAGVSCLYFLSFSTPMTDMLTLLESWRLPSVLTELMLLTYRFLFILLETAAWMTVSQRSRLGDRDKKTWLRCRGCWPHRCFYWRSGAPAPSMTPWNPGAMTGRYICFGKTGRRRPGRSLRSPGSRRF